MWDISMSWLYAITKYQYVPTTKQIMKAIDDAKRLGFKFIEMEGVNNQLFTVSKDRKKIKEHCSAIGIRIIDFAPVLPNLFSTEADKVKQALKDFRLSCELASYFDAGMIHIATGNLPINVDIPYDTSEEYKFLYSPPQIKIDPEFNFWDFFDKVLARSVSECNDIAKDHYLKLGIEPRTWENISNAWSLELLFREIASNNLGAVLDVAHLCAQKNHPIACIEMLKNRIFYVHASDSNFMTEEHLEIGTGLVDWEIFFKELQKHRYQGYISIDIGGKKELEYKLDLIYSNSKKYLEKVMVNIDKQ